MISSPTIAAGTSFSMTFNSTRSIAYRCTIHSYMHWTIRVVAASATVPPTDAEPLIAFASALAGNAVLSLGTMALAGLAGFTVVVIRLRRDRSS